MKQQEFKFDLNTMINYQGQPNIIVGRAQYLSNSNKYFLQLEKDYKKDGLNFTKCTWVNEEDLSKKSIIN